MFSNPIKGRTKILEISIESPGHDAERETNSNETTKSGHPRNFITNKSARFAIVCKDMPDGRGVMGESIEFRTDLAAPVISITRATYGYLKDPRFVVDATPELQAQVGAGSVLSAVCCVLCAICAFCLSTYPFLPLTPSFLPPTSPLFPSLPRSSTASSKSPPTCPLTKLFPKIPAPGYANSCVSST